MSVQFQRPVDGSIVKPVPGGISGRPPNGFVYPFWLPQIPGTIVPVEGPEPPHDCPIEPLPCTTSSSYVGSGYDDSISYRTLVGKSLRDCEVKSSYLENCTLVDCLLIDCSINNGSLKDVELRSCKVFSATIHDAKTSASRFGTCTITEADATDGRFYQCTVGSSEVKSSSAWQTAFRDATIKNMKAYKGCTFADCGGEVPKMPTEAPKEPIPLVTEIIPDAPDCPLQPISQPSGKSVFAGSRTDAVVANKYIINETLTNCEVKDCFLSDSTLTDCLVVNCSSNNGTFKDVELRSCVFYKANINDVKALDYCKFGDCSIHEGDLQNSHYHACTVTSSEVTNGIAWATKFRDAELKNVQFQGKCKFSLCGGQFPKKETDSDSEDEMMELPPPYNPNAAAASPSVGGGGAWQQAANAPSPLLPPPQPAAVRETEASPYLVGQYSHPFAPRAAEQGGVASTAAGGYVLPTYGVPVNAPPSYATGL